MEINKYYKRVNGKPFNGRKRTAMAIQVKSMQFVGKGYTFLNNRYSVKDEDIEEISVDEYERIQMPYEEILRKHNELRQRQLKRLNDTIFERFGLREGDWVRKANWTFFKGGGPVVQVRSLYASQPNTVHINNISEMHAGDYVKITEDEAIGLMLDHRSLGVSEPIPSMPRETTCLRNDNGEPKHGYPDKESGIEVLFSMMKRNPGKPFQLYECPYCGSYHIGKRPADETIAEYGMAVYNSAPPPVEQDESIDHLIDESGGRSRTVWEYLLSLFCKKRK